MQMSDSAPKLRQRCPVCLAAFRTEFTCCPVDGAALAPPEGDADPLIGADLAGRYVLEELVGEGSMGLIYRARHVRLPRVFAIKILFGDLVADPRMRLRFAQEAALASRLSHPNVVSVVDFGRSERGLLYLVMDFVEGEALSDVISREAPFDPLRVCRLARQLAEGLGHAHEHGLVHRDFKPGNVILQRNEDGDPVPRILDFGLAISTREREDVPGRLTEYGFVVGTPIYIAPEQALDHAVDHRADLFALGVVMYEMLAGKPPFDGSPVEIAHKNVALTPPLISQRCPGVAVAPELEGVVRHLLEKAPDQRFASGAELCVALDTVERDGRIYPTEPAAGQTLPQWAEAAPSDSTPSTPAVRRSIIHTGAIPLRYERWMPVAGAILGVAAVLGYGLIDRAGASSGPRLEPQVHAASAPKVAAEKPSKAADKASHVAAKESSPNSAEPSQVAAVQPQVAPLDPDASDPAEPRVERLAARRDRPRKPRVRPKAAQRARDRDPEQVGELEHDREAEQERKPERLDEADGPLEPPGGLVAKEIASEPEPEPAPTAGPEAQPTAADEPRAEPTPAVEKREPPAARPAAKDSIDQLVREYREVGEALDALQSRRGEQAASHLRDRYFRLPYSDALRIGAVRRDTLIALDRLHRDVRRAMQRAQAPGR
jgi:eukaryotic-like serine/threonine-protein kinase